MILVLFLAYWVVGAFSARSYISLAVGLAFLVFFLIVTARRFRRFRFRIAAEGLDLRTRGIARQVGWQEIDALVLIQPPLVPGRPSLPAPQLVLIPVTGSELADKMTVESPVDGRPARLILDCGDVRQPAGEIAEALTRWGGGRFTDARHLGAAQPPGEADFTVVLRGYDQGEVDDLIRLARTALAEPATDRRTIKQKIGTATPTVVLRGYDRGQVDAYLTQLAASLGS
jgi:DivIVA domain-containing protein